jgi:hypothetical protein
MSILFQPKYIPTDKVMWVWLSGNQNAIPILEQNLDKIHLTHLSSNPNAIDLLEQNIHKMDKY